MESRNCSGRHTYIIHKCVEMTPSSKTHKPKKRVKMNEKKTANYIWKFLCVPKKKLMGVLVSHAEQVYFLFHAIFFLLSPALNPIHMPSNAWKRHKYVLVSKNQSPMRKSDLLLYFNNVFPFYIIFLFSHLAEWFGHRVLIYFIYYNAVRTLHLHIAHDFLSVLLIYV